MMRRSRISVRPNVRPGGRGPVSSGDEGKAALGSTAGDAGQPIPSPTESPSQPVTVNSEETVALTSTPETPLKKSSDKLEKTGQDEKPSGAGSSVASSLQRRKRFSAMPNLAKPRVTPTSSQTSAVVPVSTGSAKKPSDTEPLAPLPVDQVQTESCASHGPRSPGRPAASVKARQSKAQEKPGSTVSLVPGVAPESVASSQGEINNRTTASHSSQSAMTQQTVPSSKPTTQVPSLVHAEVSQDSTLSEKALPSMSTEPLKGGCVSSDRLRIAKERKLKELMKQEMKKEKKRSKPQVYEFQSPLDPSKVTMRDLVYYLPPTNPMKTQLVENATEKGTPTASRDEFAETIEKAVEEQDDYAEDEEQQLMVPKVKVAEDGSLIIDDDSLTVQVRRSRGPAIVEDTDPIFERGSTTTYSSFRTLRYTKHWSSKETDMFFLAISMVGTDFSMIGQLFPHRARTELKNKFKKEEKVNCWRIDKAFREKQLYDQEFFSKMLEKVLTEDQMKRNKPRRCSVKKPRRKKKVEKKDDESPETVEDEVDSNVAGGDLDAAEKENEDSSNVLEPENNVSTSRKRNKRKAEKETKETSPKSPKKERKRRKKTNKSIDDEVVAIFGDSDDDVNDGQSAAEQAVGSTESAAEEKGKEETTLKLARSRGRLRKPLPNVGKRGAKRASESLENGTDNGSVQNEVEEEAADSQRKKAKKTRRVAFSDECTGDHLEEQPVTSNVQDEMLNKPTRSGRTPKLSQKLNQAVENEQEESPPPETSPVRKSKSQTGKPKPSLAATRRKGHTDTFTPVSLQLSSSEANKDEHDIEHEEGLCPTSPEEQNQLPVPVGLCSSEPLLTVMEETMEEAIVGPLFPEQLDDITEDPSDSVRTLLPINDSELLQNEETQNTGHPSVTVEFPHQALLEMAPEPSLSHKQRNQSLSGTEAPVCVGSAISDMVASENFEAEPVEETNLMKEITQPTELPEEPKETVRFTLSSRELFGDSLDPSVQKVDQGIHLLTKSTDLPAACHSRQSPDVGSQKPAEDMKILDNIQETAKEEKEASEEQNLTRDKLKLGQIGAEKGSDPPVKTTCKGKRQFPKPNLSQSVRSQHMSTTQNSDPPSTSILAGAVLMDTMTQVSVKEEEKHLNIVQVVTPEHSKEDKRSPAKDETWREAGALEETVDLATSVHNVLPRASRVLRPTVQDAVLEKPVREVPNDCESLIMEPRSEENDAEESKKQIQNAQRAEDCSDSAVGSHSSLIAAPSKPIPKGRSWLPKPRPNLSRTSRTPSAVRTQSADKVCAIKNDNEDNHGDLKTVTSVDENRIPQGEILDEETEQSSNVVGVPAVEERTIAAPVEPGSFSANVASCLPVEIDPCSNTAQVTEEMSVTTNYMESEPTFILTLFPVTNVVMEPHSELLMTESEPQSSKSVLEEPCAEGTEVSHVLISDPFVLLNVAQDSDIKQEQVSEQRSSPHQVSHKESNHTVVTGKEDPENSSEPHESQALAAEPHAPVVARTTLGTRGKTLTPSSPVEGKKKLSLRSRRAKPNIKGKQTKPKKEDQAKLEEDSEQLAAFPPSPPTFQCGAEDTGCCLEPLSEDSKAEDCVEGGCGRNKPSQRSPSPPKSLKPPLTQSGRKPKGFLSFMSGGGTSETAPPLGTRSLPKRPSVNTSLTRRNRISTTADHTRSPASTARDRSPLTNTSEVPSTSESRQNEFLSMSNISTDEEPSNVSEFFFSDIFTEVEDPI